MRLWSGPWVVKEQAGFVYWAAPDGVLESLDTRSIPQCAAEPGVDPAEGAGLFRTDDLTDLGAGYVEVPEALNAATRTALEQVFGITGLTALTPRDLLIDLLTKHADPTGQRFCPPVMPDHTGRIAFRWGGFTFEEQVQPESVRWPLVIAVLHMQYRELRRDALAGVLGSYDSDAEAFVPDYDFHRRWLTVQMEKFRVRDPAWFIPDDLPAEEPLPHHTSFTETFNKADSGTLGPVLSWTEHANGSAADSLEVISNQCAAIWPPPAGLGTARADSDLSSSDATVQVDLINLSNGTVNTQAGPLVRYSGAGQTAYMTRAIPSVGKVEVDKLVAGILTDLSSGGSAFDWSEVPVTLQIYASGSTLRLFVGGVKRGSDILDTTIASGTRGGLFGYLQTLGSYNAVDNFVAEDLPVAAGPYTFIASTAAASANAHDVTTSGINTTGANLIVVGVHNYSSTASQVLSDSKGNLWTQLTVVNGTDGSSLARLWYCFNPTVGSGHTFNVTANAGINSYPSVTVLAVYGAISSPFDQENGHGSTGQSSIAPGSVTPSQNNELLVAIATPLEGGHDVVSVDSGFTLLHHGSNAGTNIGYGIAYQIQTTATARNPTFTFSATDASQAAVIATFKAGTVTAAAAAKMRRTIVPLGTQVGKRHGV